MQTYRFDCEYLPETVSSVSRNLDGPSTHHSRFHCPYRLVLGVVWYVWRSVEQIVDTMAGVITHHTKSGLSCDRFTIGIKIGLSDEGAR